MTDSKQKTRYNLRRKEQSEKNKEDEKKFEYGSESDGDDSDVDESEEEYEESSDSYEMDEKEYKKFLAKLFPSKFINKKIKEYEEIDKELKNKKSKRKS